LKLTPGEANEADVAVIIIITCKFVVPS